MIGNVETHIEANQKDYRNRLDDFLRIQSISTDDAKKPEMRRAAEWIRNLLTEVGLDVEIMDTAGHPCVVADSGPTSAGGLTILVYGHYDVQPVGDLSLWNSGPFEPTVRNGRIYARGAADDKGQVLAHLLAVEAWREVAGNLPVRVKFIVEGEEEIGSPSLVPFITEHRERLACDYVAISDTAKFDDKTPAITYGTKGLIYKEIEVTGPDHDLHSGSFGGTVLNPANALAAIVAALKDEDNRITIPGFYDDVLALSREESEALKAMPFDEAAYREDIGSPVLDGEAGHSTLERRWVRPTLDVNGLFGGFMGDGASTIIPAKCGAKVSMRIVPNQDPERVSRAFDAAVRAACPAGVRVTISTHAEAAPYVCPMDSPGMRAAATAVEAGFRTPPLFIREGGTLPILPEFKRILGADSLLMGLCLPNCNAHGPNEFLVLDDLWAGIRTSAHFLAEMAATAAS